MIDLNCDMGESYGRFEVGNDAAILPLVSSCNIACGFHGGDPLTIQHTIELALKNGVKIGAHPGFPDLMGFGRRNMQLSTEELGAILLYQISAIKGMVESLGGKLHHVKPHGALYNEMAKNESWAKTLFELISQTDPALKVFVLAGSKAEDLAREMDMNYCAEAFVDRQYEVDGSLRARRLSDAVIHDPAQAVAHLWKMVLEQKVRTYGGEEIPLVAQTFCIHGDHPNTVEILEACQLILKG